MAKDAVATMGGLLPDDAGGRDAVHVAVVSALSDIRLRPGQDVGVEVVGGRDVKARVVSSTTEKVGIVDPYLSAAVEPGQRFWLYLNPRSITGLNHNWSHPAFPDVTQPVGGIYNTPAQKLDSEQWLRDFCESHDADYDCILGAINNDGRYSAGDKDDYFGANYAHDYFTMYGRDASGEIPSEFWVHAEIVTGKKLSKRPEYFSCSC